MRASTEALRRCAAIFGHIVVVTNPARSWKGDDDGSRSAGDPFENGRGDRIGGRDASIAFYYGRFPSTMPIPFASPSPGWPMRQNRTCPLSIFSRSVMVGNNISDMEFGRNAGMYTVFFFYEPPIPNYPFPTLPSIWHSIHWPILQNICDLP